MAAGSLSVQTSELSVGLGAVLALCVQDPEMDCQT